MKLEYEYWLAAVSPLTSRKKKLLGKMMGNAKEVYHAGKERLECAEFLNEKDVRTVIQSKDNWDINGKYEELKQKEIDFIPYFDEKFPRRLNDIPLPPYAVYVKGNLPREDAPAAAIVGARNCSAYGERMALEFAGTLAQAGVRIISGMARGIDGAGHRGALNAGGLTYGVLGCGVDVCYPREHIGLYMDIQKKGGILSEQPVGAPPLPGFFPARNRIISGLADIVLVMEAKEKSGSLITADMALEQGKDVYVLPGPVTSPLSRGCNRLIRQGAGILLSPQDMLEEMCICRQYSVQNSDKNEKMLESTENMVYSCLGLFPKSMDQLIKETGLSSRKLMDMLVTLELDGYIKELSKNHYIRIK